MTIDLRPTCDKGQRVRKGDILTEGYSNQGGELALGKNLLVAYMPWQGYNYEDAIVLNQRVVREDLLTSVHVDEYILEVRETKRGMDGMYGIGLKRGRHTYRLRKDGGQSAPCHSVQGFVPPIIRFNA